MINVSAADAAIVKSATLRLCAEKAHSRGADDAAALYTFAADQIDHLVADGCLIRDSWRLWAARDAIYQATHLVEARR